MQKTTKARLKFLVKIPNLSDKNQMPNCLSAIPFAPADNQVRPVAVREKVVMDSAFIVDGLIEAFVREACKIQKKRRKRDKKGGYLCLDGNFKEDFVNAVQRQTSQDGLSAGLYAQA